MERMSDGYIRECQTDMYHKIEDIIHMYFSYMYREFKTYIYLHDRKRISDIYTRCMVCECDVSYAKRI